MDAGGAPVLVTGGSGFAGRHLLQQLVAAGDTVTGWFNPRGRRPPALEGPVAWRPVDLLDSRAVALALSDLRPAVVFHCAGAADVGQSWSSPDVPLRANALGTHHVLDAVRLARMRCAVLVTGSALIYRASSEPLREESRLGPASPYAFSKLAQEMIALQASDVPVVVTRSFNHAGPGQSDAYVTSSFARQIAEAERGVRDRMIDVGNLEARRDITDVRDTVRAYRALVAGGRAGTVYNVCRGEAYRIGDLLDTLLGMSRVPMTVRPDSRRVRPADNPLVLGDHTRLTTETGWAPAIPIEHTLADLLEFWREAVASPR